MCEVKKKNPGVGEPETPFKRLSVNEVFLAEDNPSQVSIFSMIANGQPLGRFTSSGVLLSTGSGSSGWLYGAKRMTNQEVRAIL